MGRLVAAFLVTLALAGCARTEYVIEGSQELVTLANLRPNARGVISSINGWRGTTILPVCTPVRIERISEREVRFVATGTNRRYRYILHRSSGLPIEEHVNRYFGGSCPNVQSLPQADQQGIQTGRPMPGMTRQGVIIAAGYPPDHVTPTLDAPTYTYWGDSGQVQVSFNGNVVTNVAAVPGRAGYRGPRVIVR